MDSAGMLAFKKDRKIIDDSDKFSNVIRLKVFLITGKWVNFYFNAFFSSEYDSELDNLIHFIRKLTNLASLLKNLVVFGSSPHEFEMYYGCVFHFRIYCIIYKMERWSNNNWKFIFLFYLCVKNMLTYGTIL